MKVEGIVEDLVKIILIKQKEIDKLRSRLNYIEQYIELYEKRREDDKTKWLQ